MGVIAPVTVTPAQIASEKRYLDLVRADRGVHAVWRPEPPHNLPGLSIPYFVRFRDLADPKSVEQVDPADLAKSFGPEVRLKSLTVQATDAQVKRVIEKRLGWLEAVGRQRATLNPKTPRLLKDTTPVQLIASTDFSTELYR